jgi:hypothetical protein
MPLCPQITITPVTVTSTNMTQTSVIAANVPATTEQVTAADAAAAQAAADAAAAQATAAAAFAEADTAYDTAVAANTAASTAQATANGKSKVTYSTSAPGSTANAVGDIWYQYGTSAPNVGRIIAQYSGAGGTSWTQTTVSGLVIANIDAGSITTGTLSVGVGITTGTGTFTVNAVTGALFADSATIKGQVSAESGYFGTATNGYSITSTGLVGVGNGVIIGGQIQTSTGSQAVILNGSANAIQFKAAGVVVANMLPLVSGGATYGLLMHYGATPDSSGGTRPQIFIGSNNISLFSSAGVGMGISNSIGINMNGGTAGTSISNPLSVDGRMNYPGIATGAGSTMVLVTTGSRVAYVSSSERFKQDISYINTVGWLDKVLAMRPITYKTDIDFTFEGEPNETQYGFLAEDIADLGGGLESAVVLDPLGDPFSLSYDRLVVFLTLALKELKAEIDQLKGE